MRARVEPVTPDRVQLLLPLWQENMAFHARLVSFFKPVPAGKKAWEGHLLTSLACGDGMAFAAWSEESMVGFITGQVQTVAPILTPRRVGHIADLFVREPYRRHGLGRLLFFSLRDWFGTKGVEALDINVYLANGEALAFWRGMGFAPYAERMRAEI